MATSTTGVDEARIIELTDELLEKFPPKKVSIVDFLGAQFDMGLAWVHFPVGHGGLAANPKHQRIINEKLSAAGAPCSMPRNPIGHGMCGPTVVEWGSEEQDRKSTRLNSSHT